MLRKNLLGVAAALLVMGSAGSVYAAKPDDAGAGRDKAVAMDKAVAKDKAALRDKAQSAQPDERRESCINSSEHDCAGVQKGLPNKPASPGKASDSHGNMTGKGHERGDEPGKLQGKGHKGKPE